MGQSSKIVILLELIVAGGAPAYGALFTFYATILIFINFFVNFSASTIMEDLWLIVQFLASVYGVISLWVVGISFLMDKKVKKYKLWMLGLIVYSITLLVGTVFVIVNHQLDVDTFTYSIPSILGIIVSVHFLFLLFKGLVSSHLNF